MTSADLQTRLRELSVYTNPPNVLGIPKGVFWAALALCAGYTLMLGAWVGCVFAFVVFPALYRAHRNDPAALYVWAHALRERVVGVDAANTQRTSITFE